MDGAVLARHDRRASEQERVERGRPRTRKPATRAGHTSGPGKAEKITVGALILSKSRPFVKLETVVSRNGGALSRCPGPFRRVSEPGGRTVLSDKLRQAVEVAPRCDLAAIGETMWKAWSAGHVTDAQAEELSALIEARRAVPAAPPPAPRRPVGARPRTPASVERRRRWAASGRIPPALACRFTLAEQAALAVVALECVKAGSCTLPHGAVAGRAGVSVSTVKRALRLARELGLLSVEERRVSAFRNLPNVVTVTDPSWRGWLRLGGGGGGQRTTPTTCSRSRPEASRRGRPAQGGIRREQVGIVTASLGPP